MNQFNLNHEGHSKLSYWGYKLEKSLQDNFLLKIELEFFSLNFKRTSQLIHTLQLAKTNEIFNL